MRPGSQRRQQLRSGYKLRQDTRILLTGVDVDGPLETFWAEHRVSDVCKALTELDVIGVTIPNYSFFTDGPRFQILRNRKRILLVAERLSAAGVPVSLHIHGNTPRDWDFWLNFLKDSHSRAFNGNAGIPKWARGLAMRPPTGASMRFCGFGTAWGEDFILSCLERRAYIRIWRRSSQTRSRSSTASRS